MPNIPTADVRMPAVHTYEQAEAEIRATLHPTVAWFRCLAVAVALMLIGAATWMYQIYEGLGAAGYHPPVMWGVYVITFVFWIGIGHAGTLISAILDLFRAGFRTSIYRCAEVMTVFAVTTAAMFIFVHLGRVWKFFWLVPYPNWRLSLRATQLTSRFDSHIVSGGIVATLDRELAFPIRDFTVTHETDGSTLATRSFDLPADPERFYEDDGVRRSCAVNYEFSDDGRSSLLTDLCSGVNKFEGREFPFTFFGSTRLLSQVTYWVDVSEIEIHDPSLDPPDQFWTFNTNIDEPSVLPRLGNTYRMRVELTSGEWTYVHDGAVALAPYEFLYPVEPWTCRPIPFPYYVGQRCEERYGGGEFGRLGFQTFLGTVQLRVE